MNMVLQKISGPVCCVLLIAIAFVEPVICAEFSTIDQIRTLPPERMGKPIIGFGVLTVLPDRTGNIYMLLERKDLLGLERRVGPTIGVFLDGEFTESSLNHCLGEYVLVFGTLMRWPVGEIPAIGDIQSFATADDKALSCVDPPRLQPSLHTFSSFVPPRSPPSFAKEFVGDAATDCGVVLRGKTTTPTDDCVRDSIHGDQPFFAWYYRSGMDSAVANGVARRSDGGVHLLTYDSDSSGGSNAGASFRSSPCNGLSIAAETSSITCTFVQGKKSVTVDLFEYLHAIQWRRFPAT